VSAFLSYTSDSQEDMPEPHISNSYAGCSKPKDVTVFDRQCCEQQKGLLCQGYFLACSR